jgi:predicted metal-dependent RNase
LIKGLVDPTGLSYSYDKLDKIQSTLKKVKTELTEEEASKLKGRTILKKGMVLIPEFNVGRKQYPKVF